MPRRLIVNTSPLIFLWRVSGLAWLTESCNEFVLIPEAVVSEIRAGHDGAARQCGRSLGIPIAGTLGVVLAAKRRGDIESARAVVERLLEDGLYLSTAIVTEALREVGE